jgi:uncharacterized protein (TIGR02145 family)
MKSNLNYQAGNSACYNNDNLLCAVYGRLYDHATALTACPSGWHLPADSNWCEMAFYLDTTVNCENIGLLGTDAGGKLKETGTAHWYPPNTGATNSSGFTAFAGGYAWQTSFYNLNQDGLFWSSSTLGSDQSAWHLMNNSAQVDYFFYTPGYKSSVRCIKDCLPPESDAGPDQLNIQGTSTVLQGNTPESGTGLWTIISGSNGSIEDPDNPLSTFTGEFGSTYLLTWTISNNCTSDADTVQISFAPCYIGQSYGGGVIFWIDGTGKHGMISPTSDQSTGVQWGCQGTLIGTGTAIGTGITNTAAIVAGCSTPGIAARVCDDLNLNGFTDWYMPSKYELNEMYINRNVLGGFAATSYWNSSEQNSIYAYRQLMSTGEFASNLKDYSYRLRCIRNF